MVTLPLMDNISSYESGKEGKMFNVEVARSVSFLWLLGAAGLSGQILAGKNMAEILDLFKTERNVES